MLDAALAPKILDFGLSGGDPASRTLCRARPAYIAPEQLDPDAADRRADRRLRAGHDPLRAAVRGRAVSRASRRARYRRHPARAAAAAGGDRRARARAAAGDRAQGDGSGARRDRYQSAARYGRGSAAGISTAVRFSRGRPSTAPRSPSGCGRTSIRSANGCGSADLSARGRPASGRLSFRSTHARTTGSSRAACSRSSQIALYLGAFLLFAAACSTSSRTAGTTRSPASRGRFAVLGAAVPRPEPRGALPLPAGASGRRRRVLPRRGRAAAAVPADCVPRDRPVRSCRTTHLDSCSRRVPCRTGSCRSRRSRPPCGVAGSRCGRKRRR